MPDGAVARLRSRPTGVPISAVVTDFSLLLYFQTPHPDASYSVVSGVLSRRVKASGA